MTPQKRSKLIKQLAIIAVMLFLLQWLVKVLTHKTPSIPAPTVVVQKPRLQKITTYITQTGTMVAYNSVDLVARVEGYLEANAFVDGSIVPKGRELFVIEPLPYLEKVKEAEASVVAQKAGYAYSDAEYQRQQRMYKQQATSLNNVEKWYAKSIQSKAEIDKSIANEVIAKINYSYTHVLAPFKGRIGRHLVDVGNLVGHGTATNLATIEQLDPIYAYFNLSELDLIRIREAAHAYGFKQSDISKIPVFVGMQNEPDFPHEGRLNFVNTGLNASTGTMEFRALLSNKNTVLLPGLFVQVRIPISTPHPQLTIPNIAVQYDQIGSYVFTMNKQHLVLVKRVVLGALDQGVRVIEKGLTANDEVVIAGIQNATPGQTVTPKPSEKT